MNNDTAGNLINITYYTDPLCCWSWAFEPDWVQLLEALKGRVQYRYVMGGLLSDWKHYHDDQFSVARPAQMGPVWMQAGHLSGRPIYDKIWIEDPPASSFPACIAVKCAALQSFEAGEIYLRYARNAVMIEGINIAKEKALADIAVDISRDYNGLLDIDKFTSDLYGKAGITAFRADIQDVKYKGINRFPSLLVTYGDFPPLLFTGCKTWQQLLGVIEEKFDARMNN